MRRPIILRSPHKNRKLMIKRYTRLLPVGIVALAISSAASAQSSCYQNPSLEGPSQAHVVPSPWQSCYGSPDTQPGQWGITQAPSNGNSYVSFLHAGNNPNGYSEGMTQLLVPCMVAGTQYSFTVDLAHSNVYNTAGPGNCYSSLAVWGGATACARTQLLWTSGPIWNTAWQQYTITFTPTSNWCYISFEPYYITPCTGYINVMMDNISCIAPVNTSISGTNITCNGACNGTATSTPSSGTPPYSYSWAPGGQTTPTISNLCPGTYTVTVTDAASQQSTNTITITQPPALTATQTQTNINCSGQCTGTASVTVSGGVGPYTYSWAPGGQTTANVTGRCAGSYTCTITDANGCVITRTFNITQPPAFTATQAQTNILCNGQCNGSMTVTPTGGTPPYSYFWAPGGGLTPSVSNRCPGNYTCTITDANGCVLTRSFSLTQPPALTATQGQANILCNGQCTGTATITPAGGTPPYSFNWAPNGGTGPTTGSLCAGTYTATVTDANGCVATRTFNITQAPAMSASATSTPAICTASNGSATVTPTGGTAPYSYAWAPSGGNAQTATGLAANTYTCTVTDANGCTTTATVTVSTAGGISASITSTTDVSCFGGSDGTATAAPGGGTGPYTYSWAPSGGTAATETNLAIGTYTVTVTDANGCIGTATATISEPPQVAVSVTVTPVSCFGGNDGTATGTASGGVGSYTYSWTPSGATTPTATGLTIGGYTVTVTDANGCTATGSASITEPTQLTLATAGFDATCFGACDGQVVVIPNGGTQPYSFSWNTGCTSPSCNNICAGTYTITVTDGNGCTATDSAVVNQPPQITTTTSSTTSHCGQPDGSADVVASGGTGTLTYSWAPSGGTGTTEPALTPGTYTVTVTDANGCSVIDTAIVPNTPGPSGVLNASTNTSCFGACDGTADVLASAGTAPYTYAWAPVGGTNATASGLCAGTYTCTITDATGCVTTVTVAITEPAQLTVSTSAGVSICNGQSTPISATAQNGTTPYNYNWLPGPLNGGNQTVSPTVTTTYNVTVTDANGCSATGSTTVTVSPTPVAALSADQVAGCAPLLVNFTDASSVAPPSTITSWSWDFGDGTSTSQNPTHIYVTPGSYTVILTVTTSDGCTHTITMPNYINVYAVPVAGFSAGPQPTTYLNPLIFFTDESIGAATWNWSFGDINNSSSNLANPQFVYPDTGCYSVVLTVTSADGCQSTVTNPVCIDPDFAIFIPNTFTPNGDGQNETFYPVALGIDLSTYEMWIFDRWGNMIFYTDNAAKGWDGRANGGSDISQIDTYVYKIRCRDMLEVRHVYLGHVNLIR